MASDTSDAEEFYDAAEDVNLSPSPNVWVHNPDIVVREGSLTAADFNAAGKKNKNPRLI